MAELTIAELLAGNTATGSGGVSDINSVIASTIARVSGGTENRDDPFLGGVSEGFRAGGASVPGIRPDWAPDAFRQSPVLGGTAATFRESDLERIASWPIEKRSRLILQMQKAGLVSEDVSPRYWTEDVTSTLTKALSFANVNGIRDPFAAVGMYGQAKAEVEKKARPTFNFVSRDFLPPDPATVDQDIRKLAKSMFQGTDIELSDDEVQQLRGQFEGFLREQHFASEQQRLSEEKAGFDAQVATSEGRQVDIDVKAVPQVDAGARFREVFEERMKPKTDAIEQMAVNDQSRQVLAGSLGQVMQFATGR